MDDAGNDRRVKGNNSEREIVIRALLAELRRFDPEVDARTRASIPEQLEPIPVHFALAHQMSCRGNLHPDALGLQSVCSGQRDLGVVSGEHERPAVLKRERPSDATTNGIDRLLQQWNLSHAQVGRMLGCSRAAIKSRQRNRAK